MGSANALLFVPASVLHLLLATVLRLSPAMLLRSPVSGVLQAFSILAKCHPFAFVRRGCRLGSRWILSLGAFHVESVFVPQIHGAKITFFGFVKRCKTVVCVVLQICGEDFSSFYEKVC